MSWACEFAFSGDCTYFRRASERFERRSDAEAYAIDCARHSHPSARVVDLRVVEVHDPANARWDNRLNDVVALAQAGLLGGGDDE